MAWCCRDLAKRSTPVGIKASDIKKKQYKTERFSRLSEYHELFDT